ncbi:hypothetical protein BDV98DRAFT_583739 [Pterulicium gracile]|uniref:Uncharacterized protein n=1 Tax=Pterulicium gracile TaxID=1884261 RepID=A0A5C3QDH3_9AGAR|nr:hypothetical protein BDV98DRAFT_583739 [Pterula gracilis]
MGADTWQKGRGECKTAYHYTRAPCYLYLLEATSPNDPTEHDPPRCPSSASYETLGVVVSFYSTSSDTERAHSNVNTLRVKLNRPRVPGAGHVEVALPRTTWGRTPSLCTRARTSMRTSGLDAHYPTLDHTNTPGWRIPDGQAGNYHEALTLPRCQR